MTGKLLQVDKCTVCIRCPGRRFKSASASDMPQPKPQHYHTALDCIPSIPRGH